MTARASLCRVLLVAVVLLLVLLPTATAASPVVRLSWEPRNPDPGEPVVLNASDSHDPDEAGPLTFHWGIDGAPLFPGNATQTVVFNATGIHRVELLVTDADNESTRTSRFIRVGEVEDRPIFDWSAVFRHHDALLRGAIITVQLAVLSILLGLPIGVVVALGRLAPNVVVRSIAGVYVEVLRGSPLILQILAWFLIPPVLTDALHLRYEWVPVVRFTAFQAGLIALLINTSAYQAEIIRAGIQSIPGAQTEAALSLGMTKAQAMRHVVLPQAFRLIAPPMTNEFIILIKDTSLVTVIGLTPPELFGTARFIMSRTFEVLEILVAVAIIYIAMTYSLSKLLQWLERKYRIPGMGVHT